MVKANAQYPPVIPGQQPARIPRRLPSLEEMVRQMNPDLWLETRWPGASRFNQRLINKGGLAFDGTNGLSNGIDLTGKTEFSFGFWFKPTGVTGTVCLLSQYDYGENERSFQVLRNTTQLQLVLSDDGLTFSTYDFDDFTLTTEWQFAWINVDLVSGQAQCSINGSPFQDVAVSETSLYSASPSPFCVGKREDSGVPNIEYNGLFDGLYIYDEAKTLAEVQALYRQSGMVFDATAVYVDLGSMANGFAISGTDWSFRFSFNQFATAATFRSTIIDNRAGALGIMLAMNTGNKLTILLGGNIRGTFDYVFSNNVWYEDVGVSVDGTDARLWIGDQEIEAITLSGTATVNAVRAGIGAQISTPTYHFDGVLRDVKAYNAPLFQSQTRHFPGYGTTAADWENTFGDPLGDAPVVVGSPVPYAEGVTFEDLSAAQKTDGYWFKGADYVDTGIAPGSSPWSISGKFSIESPVTGTRIISSRADAGGGFELYFDATGHLEIFVVGSGNVFELQEPEERKYGEDYTFSVGYDGTTLRVFIDGELLYSGDHSITTTANWHVGSTAFDSAGGFFIGKIRDVVIDGQAVDLSSLDPYPVNASKDALLHWFDMDERGTITTVGDAHGSEDLTNDGGVTEAVGIVPGNPGEGEAVYRWEDLSGNKNHPTQDTAANMPGYGVDTDGIPNIEGNAVDQFLELPNEINLEDEWAMFAVVDNTFAGHLLASTAAGRIYYSAGKWIITQDNSSAPEAAFSPPAGRSVIAIRKRADDRAYFSFNNAAEIEGGVTNGDGTAVSYILRERGSSTGIPYGNGPVYAIILINRDITVPEREAVYRMLKAKYKTV
jgi:hypothetical protein